MSKPGRCRSLAVKLTVRIFLLVSVIIFGVTGYLLQDEYRVLETELQRRGLLTASHLAEEAVDHILRENHYALFKLVHARGGRTPSGTAGEDGILYAMVADLDGKVLAHTQRGAAGTTLQVAQTGEALPRMEPYVVRAVSGGERVFEVTAPIRMRDEPIGFVQLGLSMAETDQLMRGLVLKTLGVFALLLLVTAVIVSSFSRQITRPVQRLRDAALAVQAGDLTRRVDVDRADEIGQLASAFNAMTAALARSGAELQQKEEMRVRLLEKVISAQEDERKRIARELHDETSQALTSLMVGLKVLEDRCELAAPREMVVHLRTVAAKTQEAVHDLALQLRPSVLDDLGIVPALTRLAGDFERAHACSVAFETNLEPSHRLPAALETTFYRIAQEGLTNVARHADATVVSLLLEVRAGSLQLILEDNGRGFEPPHLGGRGPSERSLGLFGMRERAALAGGALTIETTPGQGTTLFVTVPLPPEVIHARAGANPDPPRG